jgi:putative ABC transport system ATP-binding protein
VLTLLREAVELDGQTTVMVTHDPKAAAAADRVLFLNDGRIVGDMTRPGEAEILAAMKELRRCFASPSRDWPRARCARP